MNVAILDRHKFVIRPITSDLPNSAGAAAYCDESATMSFEHSAGSEKQDRLADGRHQE
jgi:hypothetical protein